MHKIGLHSKYLFHSIIDVGNSRNALVLENPVTKQMRFVLLTKSEVPRTRENSKLKPEPVDGEKPNEVISFELLGLNQDKPEQAADTALGDIVKMCTTTLRVSEGKDAGKLTTISMILRTNGTVEVF